VVRSLLHASLCLYRPITAFPLPTCLAASFLQEVQSPVQCSHVSSAVCACALLRAVGAASRRQCGKVCAGAVQWQECRGGGRCTFLVRCKMSWCEVQRERQVAFQVQREVKM